MEQNILEKVQRWQEEGRYEEIIRYLEEYSEQDYVSIGYLAQAYNSRGLEGDYDRAVELLNMIEDFGRTDSLWHCETGYAYFHSGRYINAVCALEEAVRLDPENERAGELLAMCAQMLQSEAGCPESDSLPEVYDDEELELIEDYIADVFGDFESVFHEIISPDIHVDICLIPPDEERDFYTLVTMGMGAHKMDVPAELSDYRLERAELLLCLPPDWDIHSDEERWYWPVRLLKVLARLPVQENTWLGWGHTIDNGEAFDESTELCGSMLIGPASFDDREFVCSLPDGSEVNFYQIIPLHREEMEFKMEHGAEQLLEQLNASVLTVDPKRLRFASEKLLS